MAITNQRVLGERGVKQTCGQPRRSILQLLLLIKCHLFERRRLKVTLFIRDNFF